MATTMSGATLPADVAVSCPALLFDHDHHHQHTASGSEASVSHVLVHPLVLFHILDHHTRRPVSGQRVIGTLLGRRLDAGTVEITNCFAVPHVEGGDEVAIGKDYNRTMLGLHVRCNRKETVVGWYATAPPVTATTTSGATMTTTATTTTTAAAANDLIVDTSSLIHDFYAGESDDGDPIHLVVDTRLQADCLAVHAYKNVPIIVQQEQLGNLFHELKLTMKCNEPEMICLDEMVQQQLQQQTTTTTASADEGNGQKVTASGPTVDALQVSMERLHELLEQTLSYVDSVVDGSTAADPELGRQIADTLATVPRIRPQVLDRLFHDSLQDLLMVTYLSNITRTQLTIAEKLNASLGV